MKLTLQSDDQFRNGFSGGPWGRSAGPAQPPGNRPFSARLPGQPRRSLPSHTFCVGMLDLASVSTSVRSISNSVRRTHPTVSANLRRKPPLIARRAGHHCAPLHLSAGAGAKGERLFDGSCLELADLDAAEYNESLSGLWTRGLVIRRNIADGELAFFATWCPAGTPLAVLVTVEGRRWAIEDSFETAKNELGLDHNETRSWHGWHRHVSL